MRWFLMGLALFIFACSSQRLSRTLASGSNDFANIQVVGASNSSGSGATLPLLARLKDHLTASIQAGELTDRATLSQLHQQKILIAADYFFPTNFTQLKNRSLSMKQETEKVLKLWASQYDLVLVGLLPNWSNLDPDLKSFVKDVDFGSYKNILDILEKDKLAVVAVNETIKAFAKIHPNVRVLDLHKMIAISKDQFDGKQSLYTYPIPASPFNADKLHFTDAGQAFFLNAIIFPEINKNIPPILQTGTLSQEQMLRALKTILKSKDSFMRGDAGGYWFEFDQPEQFLKKNAVLKNSAAVEMAPLLKIADVINENAYSRPGFPIYIQNSEQTKKVSLDLSSALFYTKIDLFETTPGTYEGWGYDYWMSAGFLNPPRVNYRFIMKSTETLGNYILEWTLFPLIKGQPTDLVRLNTLSPSAIDTLKTKPVGSITYTINIQIRDL